MSVLVTPISYLKLGQSELSLSSFFWKGQESLSFSTGVNKVGHCNSGLPMYIFLTVFRLSEYWTEAKKAKKWKESFGNIIWFLVAAIPESQKNIFKNSFEVYCSFVSQKDYVNLYSHFFLGILIRKKKITSQKLLLKQEQKKLHRFTKMRKMRMLRDWIREIRLYT